MRLKLGVERAERPALFVRGGTTKTGGNLRLWGTWLTGLLVGLGANSVAGEWSQYRGPNGDGISSDRITSQWTGAVTNPVWTVTVGNALSTFSVAGGKAFTQVKRSTKEVCVALSVTNGTELWSATIEDASYPNGGVGSDDGPRTTPTSDGEAVYVLSTHLKLVRLNAANGAVVWSTNLLTGYGGALIEWQNAASPLLLGEMIYVNVNCGTRTLIAVRKTDGGSAWRSQESEAMTHATPVLASIQGVKQLIFATQNGFTAVDPANGTRLWRFNYPFSYSTSLAVSPVVHRDMVFISGYYSMGSVAIRVSYTNNAWTAKQLWRNSSLQSYWTTPVCYNGFIYGQFGGDSSAPLKCIAMDTGVEQWSMPSFGRGGTLLVNGRVVVLTENGKLVLIDPDPSQYTELARFQAVTGKCWNSPAVCDGRVYVRSTTQAAGFNFSVPELKVDCAVGANSQLQFTVRAADGTALPSDRVGTMELWAADDLNSPTGAWEKLTNSFVLTNGAARVLDVTPGTQVRRFYRVAELQ